MLPSPSMCVALAAGSELALGTGTTRTAPPTGTPPAPSDHRFLAPALVRTLVRERAVVALFGPILRRAAATLGRPVGRRRGHPSRRLAGPARRSVCCAMLPAVPAGPGRCGPALHPSGRRAARAGAARVPRRAARRTPSSGPGRAKPGSESLVRRPALWVGRDVDVAEYVRTCARARRAGGPRMSTAARDRGLPRPSKSPAAPPAARRDGPSPRRSPRGTAGWLGWTGLPGGRHLGPGATGRGSMSTCCRARRAPCPLALRRRSLLATCASGPATGCPTCWGWPTAPGSRARRCASGQTVVKQGSDSGQTVVKQ